ncbi:MinD/ParA family protein [Cronbergia sp. UHCC 0137]|uniref:MinD/ParA family ATP-binding protein n=1 Tax=Cronbergia sp. UHCC 0137 TaxID=3110239 RepID=UPI002B1EFA34|nr:MinD/ParA family protein [Cronbergia sp. UHCC 0137]MEA5618798.1 MinD/ParA family protein [Cronbergia sp. UHCC 0137]
MSKKIVSIHSFRGGTGKSNLTANLAAIVARYGYKVGIVDTDIQSPGIHVLFGFDDKKVQYTLNDYLWGNFPIEQTAYDVSSVLGKTGKPSSKIYLIPASIKAKDITRVLREGLDFNLLNEGFQELIDARDLDFLFIDTHPGLNEETLLSIAMSDVVLLILRPDRQDFQGTAVTVEVVRRLEVAKMLLLINKALPAVDFGALQEQVEKLYNAPVAGIMPLSEEMIQLGSSDLFCLRFGDHPISKVIDKVAQMIIKS